MSQSTHARENVDIFCRFLSVAPFRVDHDSVRLEAPPKPDASCLRDGELSYFELVRAVDPGIAEDQSGLRRAAERSPFGMAAGPAITSVFGPAGASAVWLGPDGSAAVGAQAATSERARRSGRSSNLSPPP